MHVPPTVAMPPFAGWQPGRTQVAMVAVAMAAVAICGLSDALPAADRETVSSEDPTLDWVPTINFDRWRGNRNLGRW